MEKDKKELYSLLKMYNSDSVSENTEIVIPQKKKKLTKHRKRRTNGEDGQMTHAACAGRTISLMLTLTLFLSWLLALTWLAIILNSQIQHLDFTVQTVVAGSQGVPEALQKCHSLSKQLQQNQTALFQRLNQLSTQINNFSTQVKTISNRLNSVEERFKASPELIKVPHDLETLTTNIATLGSQMQDMVATVGLLKEANTRLTETAKVLQTNITNLQGNVSIFSVAPVAPTTAPTVDVQGLQATLNTVKANLSLVNDTLTKKIQWTMDDISSERKQIVDLQERSENVSTRVTALQTMCNAKEVQITSLVSSVDKITSQVAKQEDHWTKMTSRVSELSAVCSELQDSNTNLTEQLSSFKKSLLYSNQTVLPEPPSLSLSSVNQSLSES